MWWNMASRSEFDGKSMQTEATAWSEFSDGRKAIVEETLASEERNISKMQDCESPSLGSE